MCALRRVGNDRVTLLKSSFPGWTERARKKPITPRERARNFLQKCLFPKTDLKKCNYSESFFRSISIASQFSAPIRPRFLRKARNEGGKFIDRSPRSRGSWAGSRGVPHLLLLAISKRIELESWDWSQIKDIWMYILKIKFIFLSVAYGLVDIAWKFANLNEHATAK